MQAISQFFILSQNGDVIVQKQFQSAAKTPENAAMLFQSLLLKPEAIEPCKTIATTSLFHIFRPPGLYVGCACPSEDNLVTPVLMIEQLTHIYKLLRDFCGKVTESSLRANITLVHELLDECLFDGFFQLTATEKLKPFIQSDAQVVRSLDDPAAHGFFGIEQAVLPSDASNRPVIQRLSQDQRQNEVFVDVIEKISVLIAADGHVTRCDVLGDMRMKSFLVSSALIKLGLNESITIGRERSQRGYGRTVHLDECSFHSSVNLSEFESVRILGLKPPEGEFSVMKYSLSGTDIRLPLRVSAYIREDGARDIQLSLQVRCEVPGSCEALNVQIKCPVTKSTSAISQQLRGPGQSAELLNNQVIWKIERIRGKCEASAGFKLIGGQEGSDRRQLGPLAVDFEISGFVCSMLQVRFLRVFDREQSYVPHRWLRYICTADSYVVQV